MKSIMGRLIVDSQGGFVVARQILDNIIIVLESIHSSVERKLQVMAIKLDMENPFDRVNHFFLFDIMSKLGFSQRFVNWEKACISRPWIAPLVNGRPTKFFQETKGFRQGCSMSLFLYLLVDEAMSKKLQIL